MLHGWRLRITSLLICIVSGGVASATADYEAMPGEYVVKVKPEFQNVTLVELSDILRTRVVRKISLESGAFLIREPMVELASSVMGRLSDHRAIEIIEPNLVYRHTALPDDPGLDRLWGLINDGSRGIAGIDVGAEKAWDIHTGAKNIIVAVIDTGVDYTIQDLAPNIWRNRAEVNGLEGVDDDGNGYIDDIYGWDFANSDNDPKDDHGHGSHVSGTIGAKGNDGYGIVGVNWDIQIMALKFLKAKGGGTLDGAISAIDYAVRNGASVLNNSWGGGGYSDLLKQAIMRANQKNVLFIAAAGNNGSDNDAHPVFPSSYQLANIISVAAINPRGELAGFSCYGAKSVHIAAPGVGIISTIPGGYTSMDGTSMAAPHVTGVVALVWSHQPNLSMRLLRRRILATAVPKAGLKKSIRTGGVINAFNAITNTIPPKDPNDPTDWAVERTTLSTVHPYSNQQKKSWKFNIPGAKRIAIHFSKFETERGYDFLDIKDSTGKLVTRITGKYGDIYSEPVDGDTIYLEFVSDKTKNGYGFDIIGLPYQ